MSRRETKFYLKVTIITLFLLVIFGYSVYEGWNYATGPKITILSPTNGSAVAESFITIHGQTKNTSLITLNERPISIDEHGQFNEKILLSYGYNILTMSASDRFGKKTTKTLQLVYK